MITNDKDKQVKILYKYKNKMWRISCYYCMLCESRFSTHQQMNNHLTKCVKDK